MPGLHLDYINHTDGMQQVDCGVVLGDGRMRSVESCTSPEVLAAAEALKDACRRELSGEGKIGGELGMAVEKKPEPPAPVVVEEPAPPTEEHADVEGQA